MLVLNNGYPAFLTGGSAPDVAKAAYIGGELRSAEEVSLNRAWDATLKAMNDLGFRITRQEKDVFDSQFHLTALSAGGKVIKVKLI